MENSKKRMNIIDLIALIVLVLVIGFGIYKIAGLNGDKKEEVKANITYTVEVVNKEPEIMDYIKSGDTVYEFGSELDIGTVVDVTQKPYKLETEDKENKKIITTEVPRKIALDIKISADADKKDGKLSVDGVNILIGKSVDISIGNCYTTGTIVNVYDMSEEKEAQE